MQRRYLLLFLLTQIWGKVLLAQPSHHAGNGITRWLVQKGGELQVDGSTNINKFSCRVSNYPFADTIVVNNKAQPFSMTGNLIVDVAAFDCGMPVMTHDLRKTLKVKEFPHMVIAFISLSHLPDVGKTTNGITGIVAIELAGVKKQFQVSYSFIATGADSYQLTGTQHVDFADFNIIPPKKIGGMIRTNQRLEVAFRLQLAIVK